NKSMPHDVKTTKPFELYIVLKEVFGISFQTRITSDDLLILTERIKRMFILIKELEPSYKVQPKLHQIIHYPDSIKRFGPLVSLSTLLYERKHVPFKQWARVMRN